ncbi:type VI secretion system secreted protein VgrG [Cricetibacter osteomyelitidis]|uniref:Type VI secretion system secreted protein VgrG n=1 Tax=Cricetibacter osteomyelitidis TaxID=1521931 RepID=A0A4R2SZV5_9PAST|nr:type VI secretion system tip protein TssI/VgrG [Cricetibacter osteomyelitidis]TCP95310.1 type VI secretion system secreted protein VgrG [Cricetibacter osteomyelitidis]
MTQQSDYRYSLKVNGATEFDVVSFVLKEGLSQLFRLELELASFDSSPSFAEILDNSATLTFWQGSEPVRYVNGVVTQLVQGESGFSRTRYNMVIEPDLVRASYQSDNKIFQQQDSEKILRQLLSKNHINQVEFHLSDSYWQREYCVQYRETDLAFIERLAAEEGTYYYFSHTEDGHTLHFSNHSALAPEKGTLLYNPTPAGERPEAALWHWAYQAKLGTNRQTLRDYTFTHPTYSQEHQHALQQTSVLGESAVNIYEKYDYPGRYKRDAQGEPFSRYRLEYEQREAEVALATGDDLRLIPGYRFTLSGHPRESFNQSWLAVEVEHRGWQPGILEEEAGEQGNRYENHIKFIPSATQWRPTPNPKPRVDGPQIAHVVGPAGEEIYCDDWGRVKIQFPWDREGENNENSSCWVRVSQAWAGAQFGNIAIPRIGHEVIVDFLEGDPDQPIITGRTYHSTTEPPYNLPEHKTRMSIKSKTHKGNGFNELRFEDEKDKEEIFIHAEKDQNNIVNHDETTQIGNDRTEQVGHDETINIGNNRTESVQADESVTIGQDRLQAIGRNRIAKIEKDDILNIGNCQSIEVYADHLVKVGNDYIIEVANNGDWTSCEFFEQLCETFHCEGYDEVILESAGGRVIFNGEGVTFEGNVRIEGELVFESGEAESTTQFNLPVHNGKPIDLRRLKFS